MEKIKFGIQVMMLLLAFPVWFVAEIKQADKVIKKNQLDRIETIEVKKSVSHNKLKEVANAEFATMAFSKLIVNSN